MHVIPYYLPVYPSVSSYAFLHFYVFFSVRLSATSYFSCLCVRPSVCLLLKLYRIGINSQIINWVSDFFLKQGTTCGSGRWRVCSLSRTVWCASGLVFSPCLFLIYINDMPDNVRLFVDDRIMYLTVSNQTDCQTLQTDTWENERLIVLNPYKCGVIPIK